MSRLHHYKAILNVNQGQNNTLLFRSQAWVFRVFSAAVLQAHPHATLACWGFFWTSEHHFFEQTAIFRPTSEIFPLNYSNDKAFKQEAACLTASGEPSELRTGLRPSLHTAYCLCPTHWCSLASVQFTESQNHRIVGVGRDLCGSSSPSLLPKQGHLQQAAQDLVQAGLEYLQRRRLHSLPGQPVPVLRHPQREEVLPHVQTELPVLQFVPIAPCPATGHHWKESGPITAVCSALGRRALCCP